MNVSVSLQGFCFGGAQSNVEEIKKKKKKKKPDTLKTRGTTPHTPVHSHTAVLYPHTFLQMKSSMSALRTGSTVGRWTDCRTRWRSTNQLAG